tara:strand:+ start:13057 stop:14826 length:1770 start_codon:yes stop_codon:yes gene_type:complete
MYPTIPSAQTILLYCLKFNITDVVISPGSRNIPLAIGFSSNKAFNCYSIVDERSAGFFALGMAQQTKVPVILLCTSGTALLNYSPAIAEAYYSNIPLIILSADRPTYQVNIGDGQTIDQNKVFGNNVLSSCSLLQDVTHHTDAILKSNIQNLIKTPFSVASIKKQQSKIQNFNEELISSSFLKAIQLKKPLHLNVPFEEPLYDFNSIESIKISKKPILFDASDQEINLGELKALFEKKYKTLLLVGCSKPSYLSKKTQQKLAEKTGIVVLTESTSNLNHKAFFGNIDQIIAPIEALKDKKIIFSNLKPQILITLGGMVVSKKIKQFLRDYSPLHHLHVGLDTPYDTYFIGVKHIKSDPNLFFEKILLHTNIDLTYRNSWTELSNRRQLFHEDFIKQAPFSDLIVFSVMSSKIPANYQVHIANSSPIRYLQLFKMSNPNAVYCNRGTSGIDGSTSTAVGASVVNNVPTLLITGDLSFFYDANGLWNNYVNSDFRIIIINNHGGGIFRILPGHKENKLFSSFIETKHNLSAKQIAKMHGFIYQNKKTKLGLRVSLMRFFRKSSAPRILEITTSSKLSSETLKNYFKFLSNS